MKKSASAAWSGSFKEGRGTISTETGVLHEAPYGFRSRFESGPGTNPEELIGAAHAACFSMAFAAKLGAAGFTPERIETRAEITFDKVGDGFAITRSHLTMRAAVPGIDEGTFRRIALDAKEHCPVSRVLAAEISMDAQLA